MAACDDKFHEECGVFAIYDRNRPAALETYYGVFSLQHRGQESAGITVSDGHTMETFRGMGLVTEVFRKLPEKEGFIGIGHVRYSTTGSSIPSNIQPLQLEGAEGPLALAHNGNLVNTKVLRNRLLQSGSTFQTTMDTEIIIKLLAHAGAAVMEDRIKGVMDEIRGAYAVVACTNQAVYGFRDPFGYRPMALGKTESGYVLCSETPALDAIDAEFVRDILPGEIVRIDDDGVHSTMYGKKAPRLGICAFEYIYFARPDSVMNGQDIYEARLSMGRHLWEETHYEGDVVMSVRFGQCGSIRVFPCVRHSLCGRTFEKQVHGAYFYPARAETEGTGGTDEAESDCHECKGETNHPCGRLHCPRNNKRYHYPFAAECRRKGNKNVHQFASCQIPLFLRH